MPHTKRTMATIDEFRESMYQTALGCGLPIVSTDKAAKILAMVYVLGGSHSNYTYSTKLRATLDYIKKRFGIDEGKTPDPQIVPMIKQYCSELNEAWTKCTEHNQTGLQINWYPTWATEIAIEYDLPKNNSI